MKCTFSDWVVAHGIPVKTNEFYHLFMSTLELGVGDDNFWWVLSANPNAIPLLEKNMNKINWNSLSNNENAVHLLENNYTKICWAMLSQNPNAIIY